MNNEIYYVQNPSLGAAILWRFVCGYYKENMEPVPFPLLFIILPLIFRKDLCEVITSTQKRSGLSKVSEKLFSGKNNDRLYFVHTAAEEEKDLTLVSLRIALASHLLAIDKETAMVLPLVTTNTKNISESTKKSLNAAEKLGNWCSQITLHEICTILKVRF
ncbi:three component ABC system middle component [Lacrimispora sp.]|uniref:three component ABC system middle component n=1 Tax=Lacrimispora sp. TaxID=2719234 RepID=UPI00289FA7E9|nr:three component ABC system middle component [Lacrimispora sp.]